MVDLGSTVTGNSWLGHYTTLASSLFTNVLNRAKIFMKKFFLVLMMLVGFSMGRAQSVGAIAPTDTMKYWLHGFETCYAKVVGDVSPSALQYEAGFVAGLHYAELISVRSYVYFSASADENTISVWLAAGYKIYYFGSRNAAGKIPVRGMRPNVTR